MVPLRYVSLQKKKVVHNSSQDTTQKSWWTVRSILPEPASLPPMFIHLLVREPREVSPQPQTRIDQIVKRFHWAQLQKFMRLTKGFPFQEVLLDRRSWGDATSFKSSTFFNSKSFDKIQAPLLPNTTTTILIGSPTTLALLLAVQNYAAWLQKWDASAGARPSFLLWLQGKWDVGRKLGLAKTEQVCLTTKWFEIKAKPLKHCWFHFLSKHAHVQTSVGACFSCFMRA